MSRAKALVRLLEYHPNGSSQQGSASNFIAENNTEYLKKFVNFFKNSTHASCHPPIFERYFIKENDRRIRLSFSFAVKFSLVTPTTEVLPLEGLVEKCFCFTKANITTLKSRVNSKIISETKQSMVISSSQALLTHVWTADSVVELRMCGLNYFKRSETRLGLILGSIIDYWQLIFACLVVHFSNYVSICTIKHFMENAAPIGREHQGNDFGWGRQIAIKIGRNGENYGITTVSPGPVEGSIDIEICLPVEVFKAMENDAKFIEAFPS
ncbi:uncharacterized protein LOC113339538 [Papaver somniferum]|uniref:uncharacterized protein LOC113339538 n=1 Tax=Papaver somniferum TaxID=3469 RepID=UPI000E6FA314|nr:uncharacterized protein LOC113339538 [Papaver somniferum]